MVAYTFYESDNRVRRYAETLAKHGHDVEAIALRSTEGDRQKTVGGVRLLGIQTRRRDERGPLSYLFRLLQFLIRSAWVLTIRHLKDPYHIIHVHSVPDFEVFATIVPKLLGARVVLDIHDLVPEFYASKFNVGETSFIYRTLRFVEKLSGAYADHVIIANDLWYEKLVTRSVRRDKCTSIINYPDPSLFYQRDRSNRRDDHFIMSYPGTLNSHNGVDLAVIAIHRLRETAPNLRLLIIGDGPDKGRVRDLIRSHALEDRVWLEGPVPIEEIAERMVSVDLGVVPKRKDSFGNEAFSTKILEFMAVGVPVLASNTKIDTFYFNDSVVEFFESGNVDDLASKILRLYRDRDRRQSLRESALNFIVNNNWDVKKEVYLRLLDRLLVGQPQRSL